MLAAVVAGVLTQDNPLEEQVVAAQAVWEAVTQLLAKVLVALPILVEVVVQVAMAFSMVALAALVLSFFQYQQLNIQAQPQAHQQSQLAAQIQF